MKMRNSTKITGLLAVVGILLTTGIMPSTADVLESTVSGGSLTVSTAAPTLSAVTLDGTSTQTSTGTSAAWSVTDARGTGAAWAVSVSATDFTSAAGDTDLIARTIPVGDLTITPGTITAATGSDPATGISAPTLALSTSSQTLISAAGPNMGTYNLTPSFSLDVVANAYRSNYTSGVTGALNPYTSTITYTIA